MSHSPNSNPGECEKRQENEGETQVLSGSEAMETAEEIAAMETAEEIAAMETAEEIAAMETAEEIAAMETAEEIAAMETAEEIASTGTAEEIASTETAEEIASTGTAEEIASTETAEEIASTGTAEEIASTGTAEEIASTGTAEEIASTGTAEEIASMETAEEIASTEIAEEIACTGTAEDIACTGTAEEIASTEIAEEMPSTSFLPGACTSQKKSRAKSRSTRQGPRRARSTSTAAPGPSRKRSHEGAKKKDEKKQSSSRGKPSAVKTRKDPLADNMDTLVQFLLQRYKMKKLTKEEDMLEVINKKYKKRFAEIFKRASFSMEVVFGIDVKEVDSTEHTYALVSKMNLPNNGVVNRGRGLPKTGLLMTVLGVIFMSGNCAREERIWQFLNHMRIFAGKRHFIFGEPWKLLTQDFVKLKYLEYRQVPNRYPPCYEFLWGPRASAETTKMKVLEFLAKINNTVPSAFLGLYEEALRDESERARATEAEPADPPATASAAPAPPADVATAATPSED